MFFAHCRVLYKYYLYFSCVLRLVYSHLIFALMLKILKQLEVNAKKIIKTVA